jgi:sugar lactone lactonase YvrE
VTGPPHMAAAARPVVPLRHGAAAAPAELGEGPVWNAERRELIWVDVDRGLVHRRAPGGADVTLRAGQPVGCAVPRAGGGLVLAMRDGFALVEPDGDEPRLVAPVELERGDTRMNDGACDARGRLWAGTMCLRGDTRGAGLYRLDPDLSVVRVLPGLSVSNGIGWSPEGDTLYHVDTPRRRVDVYDYDEGAGAIAGRRAVIPIEPELGLPDGLAVDADGGIWVALWGGGAVQRHSPDGELDARGELPVASVTSCCFGDTDLATMYVTTAARGAAREDLLAGRVFACRPGVRGLAPTPFAG